MLFADINNDKYTDIITVNEAKNAFTIHIFDFAKNMFNYQKTFKAGDCVKITNIAIGRSIDKLRLFITCFDVKGGTSLKILDKGKYMDFTEQPVSLQLELGSQPFIADLNGDFLEDILYTSTNKSLMVAF